MAFFFFFPACMSVCHMCPWCLRRPEESVRSLATGATDHCELLVCLESNLGLLEVLLTTGPGLQPLWVFLKAGNKWDFYLVS